MCSEHVIRCGRIQNGGAVPTVRFTLSGTINQSGCATVNITSETNGFSQGNSGHQFYTIHIDQQEEKTQKMSNLPCM